MVGSLAALSQFYTENTPAARRQLRSTIENEGVKINEEFLSAAESVIKVCWALAAGHTRKLHQALPSAGYPAAAGATTPARLHPYKIDKRLLCAVGPRLPQVLDVVQADLEALSACCERMGGLVTASKAASADLLHDMDKLQRALAVSEKRSQLVARFLDQYQLAPQEMQALQVCDWVGGWGGICAL